MDRLLPPKAEPYKPADWTIFQKIAFRFFFIFIGFQTLVAYNSFFIITDVHFITVSELMNIFSDVIFWMDRHFFHFGYNPDTDYAYFADPVYGWLFLIFIFLVAIIATLIWTLLDRKRRDYSRLHYWFRIYLSYYLFIALILYAVVKIIPVQMPYPNVDVLLRPIGELDRFSLLWCFMGASPGYAIFTGVCEFAGAFLLLFRRTRVFGSLFLATVLINVVLLNVFYNVNVKLLSIHLLLVDLFLIAPYIHRLIRFFYSQEPVSLREKQYEFSSTWKRYAFILLLLAPAWVTFKSVRDARNWRDGYSKDLKNQKLYEVTSFTENNDSIPVQMNDSLAWNKLTISSYMMETYATVYGLQGKHHQFLYKQDTTKRTIVLTNPSDQLEAYSFHYDDPRSDQFVLTGEWKDVQVKIAMKPLSIDSIRLNKERISWIYRPRKN